MVTGRPLKFQSVEELEVNINKYFKETLETEWTWTGLALFLGCTKETLKSYSEKPDFIRPLKNALLKVENGYEKDLKKYGKSGSIFALKNFDWKDKQEIDQTTRVELSFQNEEAKEAVKDFLND